MKRRLLFFLVFFVLASLAYASDCDISIEIFTKKSMYSNESIDFRFKLSNKTTDYKIEYWVEDSFGNIVKNKRNTTNLNKKSFTPKSTGLSAFTIKARLIEPYCRNISENIVFFIGKQEEERCCACETKKGIEYSIIEQQKEISPGKKSKIYNKARNNTYYSHFTVNIYLLFY